MLIVADTDQADTYPRLDVRLKDGREFRVLALVWINTLKQCLLGMDSVCVHRAVQFCKGFEAKNIQGFSDDPIKKSYKMISTV